SCGRVGNSLRGAFGTINHLARESFRSQLSQSPNPFVDQSEPKHKIFISVAFGGLWWLLVAFGGLRLPPRGDQSQTIKNRSCLNRQPTDYLLSTIIYDLSTMPTPPEFDGLGGMSCKPKFGLPYDGTANREKITKRK